MSNDTAEQTDLETAFFLEAQCESDVHDSGAWGHAPEQPATWMVRTSCGSGGLSCDAWLEEVMTYRWFECDCPKGKHSTKSLKVVAI